MRFSQPEDSIKWIIYLMAYAHTQANTHTSKSNFEIFTLHEYVYIYETAVYLFI
jgi:hypothetical protein